MPDAPLPTQVQQQTAQQKVDASAAWLQANHPEWNQTASTPAAAAATNAAYMNNTLPVLPAYAQGGGAKYTAAELQDAANETAKHNAAFGAIDYAQFANMPLSEIASRYGTQFADRVQGHYTEYPSAAAQAINQQYAVRQSQTIGTEGVMYQRDPTPVNPFPEDTAAGIAWLVNRQSNFVSTTSDKGITTYTQLPSVVTAGIAAAAGKEVKEWGIPGYFDGIATVSGRNTIPLADYSSAPGFTQKEIAAAASVTVNVPWGNYVQESLKNSKILMDYNTGEVSIYQQNKYGIWGLSSGGGRNALQSGAFTIGDAETPYVVAQGDVGKYIMPSGEGKSRLGAEIYGGFVRDMDNRLVTSQDAISRYGNSNNLANYVLQVAKGKSEEPGASIPWSINSNSPVIQYMDSTGIIKGSALDITQMLPAGQYNAVTETKATVSSPLSLGNTGTYVTAMDKYNPSSETVSPQTKGSDWIGNILRSPILVGVTAPLTGGSTQRSVTVGGEATVTGGIPSSLATWGAEGGDYSKGTTVSEKSSGFDIGSIISKGPLTILGPYGWIGTAAYDYLNLPKSNGTQQYQQRNDIVATALEAGVEGGDILLKPLAFLGVDIQPGRDLLKSYGQSGTPETSKYNTDLAEWQSQGSANDALGTKIAGERGSLEGMLKGKVNAQGQFTGNDMDFVQVQSQTALINKDVATYNEYGTKGQSILTEGFQSGSLIPTGNGGYVINPDKERPYGAFSDWSNSAQKLITGASPGQFVAYEQTPEFKNSNLAWAATEGIFKAATNPERAMSTVVQGAELYVGFSAVGGGFAALAPEAEVAPVGLTQHIGAIGSGVLQSNILTYGLLGAFGTGSVLHDTNNFKNTPQQSASNLGGTFVDYTVMFGSGAGLESSPRGVDYLSTRFAEKPMTVENAVFRLDAVQRPDVQVPSGVGGSLSYTEYHEIATQPSINILGHEIAFPRIFSPVDRPDMAWSRPVELGKGDIGSLLNARLSGTEAEPLVSSRVENIRMESFRSQDLAHVTGDVRIGEVRLPHTINDYLKMGAADAKIMGVSQEEAAASLMSDAARVTQPTTGYRLLDTYVEKGINIREAVDWSTDLQGGTSHELNRINLEDFFGSMSVTQTGSNVYRMTVTRDMQGSSGGQYDVTGTQTPEAKAIRQLQEVSKGILPGQNERGYSFKRGELVTEIAGEPHQVQNFPLKEELLQEPGSSGIFAHQHPNSPVTLREIYETAKMDAFGFGKKGSSVYIPRDLSFSGTKRLLERPITEGLPSKDRTPGGQWGDVYVYSLNENLGAYGLQGKVDAEMIVSKAGVRVFRPDATEGWGIYDRLNNAPARTDMQGASVQQKYDATMKDIGVDTTFVRANDRYYPDRGYTEHVADASAEMRNAFPEGVRNQFVDMVDRMTLKNPNMEFVREPVTTTTEPRGGNIRGGIGGPSYASPLAQQMSSPVKPLYDYAFGNRESVTKERASSGKERVTVGVPQDTRIPSMFPVAETGRGAFIPAVVSGKQSVFAQENVKAFSMAGALSQASEQNQRSEIDFIKAFEMGSDVRMSLDTKADFDTVNAFVMGSSLASLNAQESRQDQNPIFVQFTPQNQKQNQPQKQQQKQTQFQQQPDPTPPPPATGGGGDGGWWIKGTEWVPPTTPVLPGFGDLRSSASGAGGGGSGGGFNFTDILPVKSARDILFGKTPSKKKPVSRKLNKWI